MGPFEGQFDGTATGNTTKRRIRLDANTGDIELGGAGVGGDLKVKDDKGTTKIRLDAGGAEGSQFPQAATETILLSGDTATVTIGGNGTSGRLVLKDAAAKQTMAVNVLPGQLSIGGNGADGNIVLNSGAGTRINLDAAGGNIWLGGHGVDGDLLLFPGAAEGGNLSDSGKATVWLNGEKGNIRHPSPDLDKNDKLVGVKERIQLVAERGKILLGGNKEAGDLLLFDSNGDNQTAEQATIWLNAERGKILLGGRVDGKKDHGVGGDLLLFDSKGDQSTEKATIWLSGEKGDIILQNGDCAEDFDVSESQEVEPGTVMVLDRDGKLEQSTGAYDKKVAGVISGAGEYRPGIVLDKKQSQNRRLPVALVGKVYCKVDAQYSSIEVGDLLTTSSTPGHAMKAKDPLKAFGAVIGKALRPLAAGTALIPILIALQ